MDEQQGTPDKAEPRSTKPSTSGHRKQNGDTEETKAPSRFWKAWDTVFYRVGDIPWGLLLVIVACTVLFTGWPGVEEGKALLTAAGLFGIGHGIHTAAKNRI